MEGLRMTKWLLVAGGSGWTTSAEIRGEGGARSWGSGVLHLRDPSGTQHGGFSTLFHRRRAMTLVPAFPRPSSPFPAFPSAEKPKKADADQTETSQVHTHTASDLPKAAAESIKAAPQIRKQTEESELSQISAVKTENSGAVQSQTPIESLEAGAEVESTQAQFHTSSDSEPLPASASETAAVQVGTKTSSDLSSADADTAQVETQTSSDLSSAEADTAQVETQTSSDLSSAEADTTQVETQTSSDLSSAEADTAQVDLSNVPKTVHVRFVLHKPCQFGEQFLLVGEDASLGSWDPANAITLEWSDGHVWAAEVDLPIGKEIKHKFILRRQSGKITWQPGPDRVLQTSETTNTIVVAGEWESAFDQKVTERGQVSIVAGENICEGGDSTGTDRDAVTESGQAAIAESTVGAAKEKTIVQKGDAVLISGLASVPISSSSSIGGEDAF